MAPTIRTPEKEAKFLELLADTGNVTKTCEIIGVSRMAAYERREADPEFAAAWDKAKQISADRLEEEARRRAFEGIEEAVFYQGVATAVTRKYSDTLLIFLLKGAKPDVYKDRVANEHSGVGGKPIQIDDATAVSELEALLALAQSRHDAADDLV